MTSATGMAPPPIGVRFMGVTLAQVQAMLVWLMFASSFYVIAEPAPCDLFFVLVVGSLLASGLTFSAAVAPLVLFLLLYNLGGLLQFSASQRRSPVDDVCHRIILHGVFCGVPFLLCCP